MAWNWIGVGGRVALGGEGAKDRRAKSQYGEIEQSCHGLSVLECRQMRSRERDADKCVRVNARRGSEDDPRD